MLFGLIERARPTVANRRHSFWGRCDVCGCKDVLEMKGGSSGLKLLCVVCRMNLFEVDRNVHMELER